MGSGRWGWALGFAGVSHRVLFIGNSLTYFNDLPGTGAQLASSVNQTLEVASVARPNFALIDQVNRKSNAVEVIQTGMVWPESTRFEFFDEVRVSYQRAAQEVDGLFLPAEATVAGRKLSMPSSRVRLLQQVAHQPVARFAGE